MWVREKTTKQKLKRLWIKGKRMKLKECKTKFDSKCKSSHRKTEKKIEGKLM